MPLAYAKNFRYVTYDDNGGGSPDRLAGGAGQDKFNQAYIQTPISGSATGVKVFDDAGFVAELTTGQIGDDIQTLFDFPGTGDSFLYKSVSVLEGGEYLHIAISGLTPIGASFRVAYAIYLCRDGLAPLFQGATFWNGNLNLRGLQASIAGAQTYDDEIILYGATGSASDSFTVLISPSVNDIIAGTFSAFWTGTTYANATGESPERKITLSADNAWYGNSETEHQLNKQDLRLFKLPNDDICWYVTKGEVDYHANTAGTTNQSQWVESLIVGTHDHAVLRIDLGDLSALVPSGSGSNAQATVTPVVDNTIFDPFPTVGGLQMTDGVTDANSDCLPPRVFNYNGENYLPLIRTSWDATDLEVDLTGGGSMILPFRISLYKWDEDDTAFKLDGDIVEGEIINYSEVFTNALSASNDAYDIIQAIPFVADDGELLIMGKHGTSASAQGVTGTWLSGFGEITIRRPRRSVQII